MLKTELETIFSTIKLDRTVAIPRQITEAVRDLIRTKKLPPGTRIPSIQRLAKLMQTNHCTINMGLRCLMEEGLLERRPRIGTTVRQAPAKKCLGVYFAADVLFNAGRFFYMTLYLRLRELFQKHGYEGRFWLDSRTGAECAEPLPELLAAANQREIQGLIVPEFPTERMQWLRRMPIPCASLSSLNEYSATIEYDFRQMFDHFCSSLRKDGCRSVGLIVPFKYSAPSSRDKRPEWDSFFEAFLAATREFGLRTRPEWIRPGPLEGVSFQEHGINAMAEIWQAPVKPDGIIIYPDVVCEGALYTIWQKRIEVPKELKLCLHRNENIRFLCPLPAHWAETSIQAVAQVLFDNVRVRVEGAVAPSKVMLPFLLS